MKKPGVSLILTGHCAKSHIYPLLRRDGAPQQRKAPVLIRLPAQGQLAIERRHLGQRLAVALVFAVDHCQTTIKAPLFGKLPAPFQLAAPGLGLYVAHLVRLAVIEQVVLDVGTEQGEGQIQIAAAQGQPGIPLAAALGLRVKGTLSLLRSQ